METVLHFKLFGEGRDEDTGQRLGGHRFSTAASQQAEQSGLIEEPEIETLY